MGQSNSRPRSTQEDNSRPDASTRISDPPTQRDANGQPVWSDAIRAGGRRSSRVVTSPPAVPQDAAKRGRRQSMLRALRPSSMVSSSQPEGSQSSFFRKRWRSSRRWSQAPEALGSELVSGVDELGGTDGDRNNERINDEGPSPQTVAVSSSTGTQTDGSPSSTSLLASATSTPRPNNNAELDSHVPSDGEQRSSQNLDSQLAQSRGHPDEASINREVLDFLHGTHIPAIPEQDSRESEAHVSPSHTHEEQQASPRPAQFQTPSTLVFVQGVVNAQDTHTQHPTSSQSLRSSPHLTPSAPRLPLPRRSSSTPRYDSRANTINEERLRARNRLSTFIRPGSMLGRSQNDDAATNLHPSESSDHSPADPSGTADGISATDAPTDIQGNDGPTAQSESRVSPRGLSPTSIEVLGTLLRVAATATAASLFSPPTIGSSNDINNSSSAPSPTSRPLSPTPTSALGPLDTLGGLGLNSPSSNGSAGLAPDGRDRMRNAWDSIRDIVGLNSRTNPDSTSPSIDTPSAPSEQRMRTGDTMLADMARLLNAGLGLPPVARASSDGATAPTVTVPTSQPAETPRSPPAEGTFDRFLYNLQADLRNILTEESDSSPSDSSEDVSNSDPSSSVSGSSTQVGDSPIHTRPATDPSVEPRTESSAGENVPVSMPNELADVATEDAQQVEDSTVEAEEDVAVRPRVPTPIPSMWSSSPAYNETRERVSRARETGFADIPSRVHERPPRVERRPSQDERDRPVINLWRLYRFDPIPANQAQDNVSRTSQSTTAASPSATEAATSSTSQTALHPISAAEAVSRALNETGEGSSTNADSPLNPPPETQAMVVPVIVVGLQSVEARGHDDEDDGMPFTQSPRDAMQDAPIPWASQPTAPNASAGRGWGSRAASALRGLRPGGRRNSRNHRAADGTGSRTFLIYVIGGYYPPGHHMVTGSDRLDSYDALWELAELLGQAKPPTTTKDDIEKSGLEVIKASQLSQYEAEGKISSNCTDRCLVCLDDYDPEDEVRLLSCRHGFHKNCVDRWLQVGRNNCPACRTQGVSDNSPSTPSPSTSV